MLMTCDKLDEVPLWWCIQRRRETGGALMGGFEAWDAGRGRRRDGRTGKHETGTDGGRASLSQYDLFLPALQHHYQYWISVLHYFSSIRCQTRRALLSQYSHFLYIKYFIYNKTKESKHVREIIKRLWVVPGSGYNNNCVGITSVLERSKLTNDTCLKIVWAIFVGSALCGGALVAVPLWRCLCGGWRWLK